MGLDVVHVANEVNVHRGVFPNLTSINCYVDGLFLTNGIVNRYLLAGLTCFRRMGNLEDLR